MVAVPVVSGDGGDPARVCRTESSISITTESSISITMRAASLPLPRHSAPSLLLHQVRGIVELTMEELAVGLAVRS
jgi:hypothetical protein